VVPRGDRVHNTQFNLDALEALGIPIRHRRVGLALSEGDRAWAAEFLATVGTGDGPLVAINCGGGWYTKRWGLNRFAEVADILVKTHSARIVILWGPGERDDAQRIAEAMTVHAVLPPPTTLLQLAALLERCSLLVTNDSGPMHIAAAVGCRVVAAFGPTNPLLQGPSGEGHRIVRLEALDCLGCNLTACPIGHPCMLDLPVSVVAEAASAVLAEKGPRKD
jgi:ADP-heptose:LPS heptosyltransferase